MGNSIVSSKLAHLHHHLVQGVLNNAFAFASLSCGITFHAVASSMMVLTATHSESLRVAMVVFAGPAARPIPRPGRSAARSA